MVLATEITHEALLSSETGTIRKKWSSRIKVVLVYPNRYHVGMSNLGFQAVYRLLNQFDDVVCERAFLPEEKQNRETGLRSLESGHLLSDFDIIAFSISFENDYPNLLKILGKAALPLKAIDRGNPHPLVMAGGVACFSNPEPVAAFIDCFFIGEAELILPQFVQYFDPSEERKLLLKGLARNVPGVYVPVFYQAGYETDGTISSFKPLLDVPSKISRIYPKNLSNVSTCSTILTPHTTFDHTFLIEVGRGCPHGCRFCSAGYIYRPPRFEPLSTLTTCLEQGSSATGKFGLVGAAVSNHPDIESLCAHIIQNDIEVSFSSLRADALSPDLISVLKKSGIKTATIAPDAASERMRTVINKGITLENILTATEKLVSGGIPNLKLYFMIGLPTETMDDIEEIVQLCKKIKHAFLTSSRVRKRIGTITVSLNSFVPKPFTPFQWAAMDEVAVLKEKIKIVRNGLKRVANVRLHVDIPRWAYLQALFSRGDRKVADMLSLAHHHQGNWPRTFKESPLNPSFYVHRQRLMDEIFPWDFIDQGLKKSFLRNEYRRALEGKPSLPCPMEESCGICGVCS